METLNNLAVGKPENKALTPEEEEERKKILTKSNNLRALMNLKTLMDKRK